MHAIAQMLKNINFLKISIKICKDDCFDLFVLTTLINEHPLKVPFAFVWLIFNDFCAISSCQSEAEDNAQLCKLLVTCLESLPSHYPRLTRSTKQAVAASRRRTEQGTSPEFNPAIPITHHLEDFMRSSMLGPWVCFGRTRVKQLFLEKVPSHSSPDCTSPQNSIEWNCTIKAVEFF